VLVAPTATGVTAGVLEVLGSPDQAAAMALLGRERAAGFTWAACLAGHSEVWRGVVTRSGPPPG
ncbi:MAG: hypothetical protein WAL91_12635, partial [Propionicimonas sp.]